MNFSPLWMICLFLCFTSCSHTVCVQPLLPGLQTHPKISSEPDPFTATNPFVAPKQDVLIVLDPGHGGKDLGTHSRKPPYQEKYLTLTTAYMLRNYLKQLGYEAILTRDDDVFITLEERWLFANQRKTRLFVSLHYNSAPNKSAEGIEIFYYGKGSKTRSALSKKLGQSIIKQMVKKTGAKSRGVRQGDLAVIRETKMPAVLIEGGFLTNDEEMVKLKNAVYLKKLALGIAQGIKDYLMQEKKAEVLK